MNVYNKNKSEILTEYDLSKGYLIEDNVVVGQRDSLVLSHIDEYGNTITTTYDSLDISEKCLVYIPYTQNELIENEIILLKNQLKDMDYKTSKYVDGEYNEVEWGKIVAQRQSIRVRIRELEQLL